MKRSWCIAGFAVLAGLLTACAGKPFNVKTIPRVPSEALGPGVSAGSMSVRASAIWDEDWLMNTLDANLILAGVLPVRVDLENRGTEPVSTRKLKMELTDSSGTRFKRLEAKKAMKAIESYYEISISSKTGLKLYREDFLANTLELKEPLAPGETRQGLVFFAVPEEVRAPVPLVLTIRSKSGETRLALR